MAPLARSILKVFRLFQVKDDVSEKDAEEAVEGVAAEVGEIQVLLSRLNDNVADIKTTIRIASISLVVCVVGALLSVGLRYFLAPVEVSSVEMSSSVEASGGDASSGGSSIRQGEDEEWITAVERGLREAERDARAVQAAEYWEDAHPYHERGDRSITRVRSLLAQPRGQRAAEYEAELHRINAMLAECADKPQR